jgi:alkylhydroperoxidase/carboxymuconolactone decarboxylase family protein YurZ
MFAHQNNLLLIKSTKGRRKARIKKGLMCDKLWIQQILSRSISMNGEKSLISKAFQTFMQQAPDYAQAWGSLVQDLAEASALDAKTRALAYLAVLAVLGLETGIPFHVKSAQKAGASREEVISAVLVGLPAAGNKVIQALPAAVQAYDSD